MRNESIGGMISETTAATARTQPPVQPQAAVANANGDRRRLEIKNSSQLHNESRTSALDGRVLDNTGSRPSVKDRVLRL